MAQLREPASGRPAAAVGLLGAIFATALLLRVPIGPAPVDEVVSVIDARSLDTWSAAPIASMDRPEIATPIAAPPRGMPLAPASILVPVHVSFASISDTAVPEVSPRRPTAAISQPTVTAEPALASTPQSHIAGLAAPVAPASLVDSPSRPFGAVGTAFAKTGAALTIALKKTGQGILAPF